VLREQDIDSLKTKEILIPIANASSHEKVVAFHVSLLAFSHEMMDSALDVWLRSVCVMLMFTI
jgi:hypothetical protein